jgi:hypothetical protein
MKINLKKYKRIFAFGCSFTAYKWPTWADIIAVETKADYYNHAMAGMGNLGIMARVTEANARYKFNDTDLVMIMWTTFSREDRWVNGGWFAQGNAWNSQYPKDWVKEYCDPTGHMIRDHAIISITNKLLQQSNCGTLLLRSVPFKYTDFGKVDDIEITRTLSTLYQKEYDNMPMSLYDFMGRDWSRDPVTYINHDGQPHADPHPKPITYYDYLEACGLEFNIITKNYATVTTNILSQCNTLLNIKQKFDQSIRNLMSSDYLPLL